MAIVSVSTPDSTFNAVYEPVEFEFTSDRVNIFQLRSDVYVDGSYVITLDASLELGTSDEFKFDISEILQNHVTYSHVTSASGHDLTSAIAAEGVFFMKVYEVYTVAGVVTTAWKDDQSGVADHTTSTFIMHQHAINPFETVTSYLMQEGSPKPFLTLRPSVSNLLEGEFIQFDFITDVTNADFNIEEYDASGALTATTTTSVYAVIRARGTAIIDGATLASSTVKIIVWIDNNDTGNRISDTMTINIIKDCGNSPFVLHWGNYLGGMEQYTFTKRQKNTGRNSHVSMRRGDTGIIQDVTGNRNVFYDGFSDVETDLVYEFLNELPANSKNTFWKRNGTLLPIIIAGNRCTKKFHDTEDYINFYKVSFELSKKTPVIRG